MKNKEEKDKSIINARPTKELFISMLTRDITLRDAIGELVDNSVDGALKLRSGDKDTRDYSGLSVDITFSDKENYFKIVDNCGGIPVEIARNYAFRFGRPENTPSVEGSVGYFGVGMKRALFKMGKKFHVESISPTSRFSMSVDVDQWQADSEADEQGEWHFKFDDFKENESNPLEICGTQITVTDLYLDIKNTFGLTQEVKTLVSELEREHLYNIDRGLRISVNKAELKAKALMLLSSDDFKIAYWENEDENLSVQIYAGIAERAGVAPDGDGGWYIFCNDRLVLGPDTTGATGWGIRTPIQIPRYHQQFDRFRGYVFMTADEPKYLPWNTSKNNLDTDSPSYKTIYQKMIALMRSVIDFMNEVNNEQSDFRQEKIERKKLESAIEQAEVVQLNKAIANPSNVNFEKFIGPPREKSKKTTPGGVWIRYRITKEEFTAVQEYLGEDGGDEDLKASEIGRLTFNYFFDREIED